MDCDAPRVTWQVSKGVRMKPWMSVAKTLWIWLYRPLWESVLTADLSWAKLVQSPMAASLQQGPLESSVVLSLAAKVTAEP